MSIYENVWILISLVIIVLILSTDPKSSTNSIGNNNITLMFSSISESQKFIRNFSWILIVAFYFLTVLLSYLN
jgi:protein translocase SecG subunit|uniref:Probable protein-export membrane protein SecG n=1 Tax=Emiliania huxleyi TaxID=2903 RepID=Q4G3B4_EMIHU|nr:hypothetical chloroplast RF47 [Gephyrocapsa oceanica]YP_010393625.1 hypothetical chloroplast RF47 [Gephyrocapsa ericsonii]YP_010393735.1 hypothetical chloroplast RF47 [Gephyrocapsa parvula]YP_277353.1 hypothetical chloroplast RF47 [Emiliania huxleyi]AAX13852.1 hypothetical chloroplast RF47 [Emiliania huxleyi]AEI29514.1 hypothetical chloroplast RF47 [Emiliania huxleyi]UPY82414.1 hypothetical chloroplast RF47 [Emiliania huxleyi]UPY82744.1 hypothetical chloroplast RF47 [Emiliania huxleyi]UP